MRGAARSIRLVSPSIQIVPPICCEPSILIILDKGGLDNFCTYIPCQGDTPLKTMVNGSMEVCSEKAAVVLMVGKYEVTLIPGDGIGQETSRAVKAIFKYENVPIDFEEIDVHGIGDEPGARELFAQSIESLKRNRVGLKGIYLFTLR